MSEGSNSESAQRWTGSRHTSLFGTRTEQGKPRPAWQQLIKARLEASYGKGRVASADGGALRRPSPAQFPGIKDARMEVVTGMFAKGDCWRVRNADSVGRALRRTTHRRVKCLACFGSRAGAAGRHLAH